VHEAVYISSVETLNDRKTFAAYVIQAYCLKACKLNYIYMVKYKKNLLVYIDV